MPPNARILYWNINNFTSGRIDKAKPTYSDDAAWGGNAKGADCLRLLLSTLQFTDPATAGAVDLDFIVLVEIYARVGAAVEGEVIGGKGAAGCVDLLARIRACTGQADWCLVPPVVTGEGGKREGIAVYYRSSRWYFIGPFRTLEAYAAPFDNVLPNRVIPAEYPLQGGRRENRCTGEWNFTTWTPDEDEENSNEKVYFPTRAHRKPWLTVFGRVGTPDLSLRLMALHTTPNKPGGTAYADRATARLADVYEMTAEEPPTDNAIDVIVGDFNVNNLEVDNFGAAGPFGRLTGEGDNPVTPFYTPVIDPINLSVANDNYAHTHGKRPKAASLFTDDVPPHAPRRWAWDGTYPGLEYSDASIDNALVRYHGGVAPQERHTSILARARSQPYRPPPAGAALQGYYRRGAGMRTTISGCEAWLASQADGGDAVEGNDYFAEWDRYGRVWGTSDHFALLFDV